MPPAVALARESIDGDGGASDDVPTSVPRGLVNAIIEAQWNQLKR